MNQHMLTELDRIARVASLPCFHALDKLANSMMGYGVENTAGAQVIPPPAEPQRMGTPGATSMAGMSVHCDRCNAEIKEPHPKFCPRCGNRIKAIRDIKTPPKGAQVEEQEISKNRGDQAVGEMGGPTGGEESVNEELAEGSYADMGKYSSQNLPAGWRKYFYHPLVQKLKGTLAVGGGLYGAAKIAPMMANSGAQVGVSPGGHSAVKYAGVRFKKGSRFPLLHFKPKAGKHGSVEDGLTRIQRATQKNTQRILARA